MIESEIAHVVPEGRTKEDQSTGQDVFDHDASVTISDRKADYGFGQRIEPEMSRRIYVLQEAGEKP